MSDNTSQSKIKLILEIVICGLLFELFKFLTDGLSNLLHTDSLWMGVLVYACTAITIIIYISKIEKKPLSSIGLCRVRMSGILIGIWLGIIMFVAQQIPLFIIGIDYAVFAASPDWRHILVMSIYCVVCVGFTEEVMLRGFILHKSMTLLNGKVLAVILNCVIFYLIHWPPIRFVFGEFFNVTLNTLILCVYFFVSREKSISPLIIAHGVYDIMTMCLLPVAAYYFYQ